MSARNFNLTESTSYRVYVGNLPKTSIQCHIEQILDGCQIVHIHMARDRITDEFKGFAYVELRDEASYHKALSYDKTIVNDQEIRVNDADRGRSNRGARGGFNGRSGNARGVRGGMSRNDFSGPNRPGAYKPRVQPEALNRLSDRIVPPAPSYRPTNDIKPTTHPNDPNRPRISLKPRTVPLNASSQDRELTERAKSIFGVGKPRDASPVRNTEGKE